MTKSCLSDTQVKRICDMVFWAFPSCHGYVGALGIRDASTCLHSELEALSLSPNSSVAERNSLVRSRISIAGIERGSTIHNSISDKVRSLIERPRLGMKDQATNQSQSLIDTLYRICLELQTFDASSSRIEKLGERAIAYAEDEHANMPEHAKLLRQTLNHILKGGEAA